jgi:2-oxo-hept-3-ene-1,7-dioate hydratase
MKIDPTRFAAGMELQLQRLAAARADGMPRRGWKIGINVPEILEQLSLPHPGLGWLDGHQILPSGSTFEAPPDSQLRVEPEVAIQLSSPVAEGSSAASARSRIAAVHPALELVDYSKPKSGLTDVVSHSMFHAATILGDPVPVAELHELGSTWPQLSIAGQEAEPPRSDLVPSDLGELVAFAADFLAAFGQSLAEGDLLLSGAYLARAPGISAGDCAVAEFGKAGAVSVRLAD